MANSVLVCDVLIPDGSYHNTCIYGIAGNCELHGVVVYGGTYADVFIYIVIVKYLIFYVGIKIELYDKFEFSEKAVITERFVTTIKPKIDGNTAIMDDVRFTATSDATLNVVEQPYVDQLPDENGSFNKICYLLDYTLNGDTTEFKATIDFLK